MFQILKKRQPVRFTHLMKEGTRQNAGISMLFPTTDALSQTVIAIAELPNADGIWRPGMTIEGDIKVGEKQVTCRSTRQLYSSWKKSVVFIKSGNEYEPRPVNGVGSWPKC